MQKIHPDPPAVDLVELVGLFYKNDDTDTDSPHETLADFVPILDSRLMPEPQRGLLDHEAHMTVTVEAYHRSPVDVRVARTRRGRGDGSTNTSNGFSGNGAASKGTGSSGSASSGSGGSGANWYAREITLHRQSDGRPVQYGIVRLNIDLLAPQVWQEIESQRTPLGRVLIEHQVLREVELCGLWKVIAGPPLAKFLGMRPGQVTYGRTARIFCDYLPAIELLEIVTP